MATERHYCPKPEYNTFKKNALDIAFIVYLQHNKKSHPCNGKPLLATTKHNGLPTSHFGAAFEIHVKEKQNLYKFIVTDAKS